MSTNEHIKEQLSEVVSHWGIKTLNGIEKVWETDVYSLNLPNGHKAVLKKIGAANEDNIRRHTFCHEVIKHLCVYKIPVALPIPDKEGNTVVIHDDHLYMLMPYVQHKKNTGENDPSEFSRRMFNTGKSFALMHKALVCYPEDKINEHVWRAPLSEEMINYRSSQMLPYLDGVDRIRVEPILNDLVPRMNEAFRELSEQLIHRDCHYANILLNDNDEVAAFIDNDHFSIGPRILDVGYFLNSLLKFHPEGFLEPKEWLEFVSPFLKGYISHISLNKIEKNALHLATISIPLQFVGWCFETGRTELGRSMLSAMEWMYLHIDEIRLCVEDVTKTKER
ncbi:TPA: hypothetical protein DCR49_03695 [Candidatus Delongbacteria bacterium]|nr:MAG: hypothetical protein A2Y40_06010 [Candidatus Margulisbacteria bacterium GWF2_35_9]HAQ61091.1 hypothetical protein [Candidatus Delongbacteria bacterium]